MPSDKDIVEEARQLLLRADRIHALNDRDPSKDEDIGWLLRALADEVERLRPIVNAAVEWRRVGYERKDEFSYRIDPLLDAIDIYDVGQLRPCEEL